MFVKVVGIFVFADIFGTYTLSRLNIEKRTGPVVPKTLFNVEKRIGPDDPIDVFAINYNNKIF
jgi:hypothetical protein